MNKETQMNAFFSRQVPLSAVLAVGSLVLIGQIGLCAPPGNVFEELTVLGNTYLATEMGRVGVGTTNPGQKLTVAGTIESTAGGIKFPDGTIQSTAARGAIPSGAVLFFRLDACPEGFSELAAAQGRYVVGMPDAGTVGATVGTALSDQENRTVGRHDHGVTDPGHAHEISPRVFTLCIDCGAPGPAGDNDYGWVSATQRTATGISVNPAGDVAGTNAPYIQLLACEKD